jgi:putative transcriptional regulator
MDVIAMPVRLNLKEWRNFRGLSQLELSERSGVRKASIVAIEKAQAKSVSFELIERLCRALDVHPSQLWTDEKPGKK